MIRLPALLLLLLLTACTSLSDGGLHHSTITGVTSAESRQEVVSRHMHHVLIGYAVIQRRGDDFRFLVELGQVRDGVHHRLRMDSAWHEGTRLSFRGLRRGESFCHGNTCSGYRVGTLGFRPRQFLNASRTGYPAHLLGPDATVEVMIPAELFAEALDRAHGAGVLSLD